MGNIAGVCYHAQIRVIRNAEICQLGRQAYFCNEVGELVDTCKGKGFSVRIIFRTKSPYVYGKLLEFPLTCFADVAIVSRVKNGKAFAVCNSAVCGDSSRKSRATGRSLTDSLR